MSNIINKIFPGKRNTKQSGYSNQVSNIGQPFEVKHNVHVGINITTGKIEGLPEPWRNLINGSNISPSEQLKNPEAVINALKLVTYSMKRKPEKYLVNQDMINSEIKEIEDCWPRSKESSKILLDDDDETKNSKFVWVLIFFEKTGFVILVTFFSNFQKDRAVRIKRITIVRMNSRKIWWRSCNILNRIGHCRMTIVSRCHKGIM